MSLEKSYCDKVLQWLVLAPLLFLLYINDIFLEIESICKIFVDDRPFFTVVEDDTQSQNTVYDDLKKFLLVGPPMEYAF